MAFLCRLPETSIEVLPRQRQSEPPFVQPVFADDVLVDGSSGRYRFLATMLQGGAPQGGEAEFYVSDPAEMPAVTHEIMLRGEDAELGIRGVCCRASVSPCRPTPKNWPIPSRPLNGCLLARRGFAAGRKDIRTRSTEVREQKRGHPCFSPLTFSFLILLVCLLLSVYPDDSVARLNGKRSGMHTRRSLPAMG